jgi:hypothetical protein
MTDLELGIIFSLLFLFMLAAMWLILKISKVPQVVEEDDDWSEFEKEIKKEVKPVKRTLDPNFKKKNNETIAKTEILGLKLSGELTPEEEQAIRDQLKN